MNIAEKLLRRREGLRMTRMALSEEVKMIYTQIDILCADET